MDKLLINKYGETILFNEETNVIIAQPECVEVRNCFFAKTAGQAISDTEVVDYNAGDLVIVLNHWGDNKNNKVIVITDVVAKDDISRWLDEIKKQDEVI